MLLSRFVYRLFLAAAFLGIMAAPLPSPARAAGVVSVCTQAALEAALAGGGLVTFSCGPATITLSSPLAISQTTTLDGGGNITLSGGNTTRLIEHTAGTLTLQNLTLTNGRAQGANTDANGAAVRSRFQGTAPTLNLTNVNVTNNVANLTAFSGGGLNAYDFGGAIFTQGGYLNVSGSTFSGNTATNSAGAAIHGLRSDVVITNSTFSNNISNGGGQGGALYVDGAQPNNGVVSISGSAFTGNRAHNQGGALYVHLYQNNDAVTIDRSAFIDNQVNGGSLALGGAFSGGNGRVTVTNSLFSANAVDRPGDADGSGGAFASAETAVITIANSTFTGNRAEGMSFNANGGAIYIVNNAQPFRILNSTLAGNFAGWVGGGVSSTTNGTLINTIFAHNTADNGPNDWQIQQHCSAQLGNGGGNFQFPGRNPNPNFFNEVVCAGGIRVADPLLAALANNGGPTQTMALPANSPAVDAGVNGSCTPAPVGDRDQRGAFRSFDGSGDGVITCDSGAYEFTSFDIVSGAGAVPRRYAFTSATPTLTWQPLAGVTAYEVEIDNTTAFAAPLAERRTGIGAPTMTTVSLFNGVYFWRVRAQVNGQWGAWSTVESFAVNAP